MNVQDLVITDYKLRMITDHGVPMTLDTEQGSRITLYSQAEDAHEPGITEGTWNIPVSELMVQELKGENRRTGYVRNDMPFALSIRMSAGS